MLAIVQHAQHICEHYPLLWHIFIFSVLMFPLKISHAICIKLLLTLNFKILSDETFVFISINELVYPHKITCMNAAPPVSPDDVILRFISLCLFR